MCVLAHSMDVYLQVEEVCLQLRSYIFSLRVHDRHVVVVVRRQYHYYPKQSRFITINNKTKRKIKNKTTQKTQLN